MVVLDSSAIISLIKIGKLALIRKMFKTVLVPKSVWQEVVEEGKKLGKPVSEFEKGKDGWFHLAECKNKTECEHLAKSERINFADAEVLLVARDKKEILLTNDAGLKACCLSRNVNAWWLTTLLLAAVKKKLLSKNDAEAMLFDLVTVAKIRLSGEILSELLSLIKNI